MVRGADRFQQIREFSQWSKNPDDTEHRKGIEFLRRLQEKDPPRRLKASTVEKIGKGLDELEKEVGAFSRMVESPEKAVLREANEKARRARQIIHAIATARGVRYSPEETTIEKFECNLPQQMIVKARVQEISRKLPEMIGKGHGIIFYGNVGTGKDHLLMALLYAAAGEAVLCRWINGQDLFGEIRDRTMDGGEKEARILREFLEPKVLAISDLVRPAGILSDFRLEFLYRLVDKRYSARRGVWLTLNVDSPEEAEGFLMSSTWDRLQHSAEFIPCFWPSYREQSLKPFREECVS
jgi:DNA replication protein DnaC